MNTPEPTDTEGLQVEIHKSIRDSRLTCNYNREGVIWALAGKIADYVSANYTPKAGTKGRGNLPTPSASSPAIERARLEAKIDEIYGLITPIYADPFFEPDYVLNLRGHDLIGRINELQAALNKLDKEQK
jgi:hypothetical protein